MRSNLAVSRPGPGFSAGASESGKVPFSGGPKWLEINAGRRFRRNWNSRSSSNLSCRTSPPAPAVRHRSSASTKYSTLFNYVLKHVYLGCQWKELPIDKDGEDRLETHYTRIYRIWRRWLDNGCIDAIFTGSVSRLHQDGLLDTAVIHGDGTTAAAKK